VRTASFAALALSTSFTALTAFTVFAATGIMPLVTPSLAALTASFAAAALASHRPVSASLDVRAQRQYFHFCTSKASKPSTSLLLSLPFSLLLPLLLRAACALRCSRCCFEADGARGAGAHAFAGDGDVDISSSPPPVLPPALRVLSEARSERSVPGALGAGELVEPEQEEHMPAKGDEDPGGLSSIDLLGWSAEARLSVSLLLPSPLEELVLLSLSPLFVLPWQLLLFEPPPPTASMRRRRASSRTPSRSSCSFFLS